MTDFNINLSLWVAGNDGKVRGNDKTGSFEGGVATPQPAFTENLNEKGRRRSLTGITWNETYVEDPLNNHKWEPDMLWYIDQTSGHEVMKMTGGLINSVIHPDISMWAFSADGKRFAFQTPRGTQAYVGGATNKWFLSDSNGLNLRPLINAPERLATASNDFFHWSRQIPDVYYCFPRNDGGLSGFNIYDMYKVTITDDSSTYVLHLTFPSAYGALKINKLMSGDGKKVNVMRFLPEDRMFPATIEPVAALDTVDGYNFDQIAVDLDYGDSPTSVEGGSPSHDQYMDGKGDYWFYIPSNGRIWFGVKRVGSGAGGIPVWSGRKWIMDISAKSGPFTADEPMTFSPSGATGVYVTDNGISLEVYLDAASVEPTAADTVTGTTSTQTAAIDLITIKDDFGDIYPINAETTFGGTVDPFSDDLYFSHFMTNPWGDLGQWSYNESYSSMAVSELATYGDNVGYAMTTQFNTDGVQHHAWHAISDWTIFTAGEIGGVYNNPYDYPIYTADHTDGNSTELVCLTHARETSGPTGDYGTLPRPAQSPDSTKSIHQSDFLSNTINENAVYIAVARYPLPPTTLAASGAGILTFLPPTYTTKGWPTSTDPVPYAREVKQYRLWQADNVNGPWTPVDFIPQTYSIHVDYDFQANTADCTYTVDTSNGTRYFALTTEENSDIASRILSEILQVTFSGGLVAGTIVAQAEGQTNFWTTTPAEPSNLSVVDEAIAGHETLSWLEPSDADDLIRFYNFYYSDNGPPPATQEFRCRTVPKGHTTILDYEAVQTADANHNYRMTAMDKYGNESPGITVNI